MRTIYYYQTFVGLQKLSTHLNDIDIINISSIHFDEDGSSKSIYLNDHSPYDPIFDDMWRETEMADAQGVTIMLMIGGAGGAYTQLFQDFDTYYPQLKELLSRKSFLSGVDLDIEESIDLSNVIKLIDHLKRDFPDLKISMAPIASAMTGDSPGLGGFSYKDLLNSEAGSQIDWWNVQCYNEFSATTFQAIVTNGYDPRMIHMGMMSGQYDKDTFQNALSEIQKILLKYPMMGGVFDWEYLDAPPDPKDPSQWCHLIKELEEEMWEEGSQLILE